MDVGVILLTLVVGLLAAALWWSLTNKNSNKPSQQKSKGKSNNKQKDAKKKSSAKPAAAPAPPVKDSSKSNFTHSWLLTSLKGHTGPVTDLDFSPDGKYLATCSEELDDEVFVEQPAPTPTFSASTPSETDSGIVLSRRQKRNRSKKKPAAPKPKPVPPPPPPPIITKKQRLRRATPLKYYVRLQMKNSELYSYLCQYVLHDNQLINLGYPVESAFYPDLAIIYKTPEANVTYYRSEFCRTREGIEMINPTSPPLSPSLEKRCVRCRKGFFVTLEGEYLTEESCSYHWGTYNRAESSFVCCNQPENSSGCVTGCLHVWNGVSPGMNGPYSDYVKTNRSKTNRQIYALDTEMLFTGRGLEVGKVSVISIDGCLVYETLVKPERPVVDYNTRFSGLSQEDYLKNGSSKTVGQVQQDLLALFSSQTILIGHGLENDLRALRILHNKIIDTAVLFPHYYGFPFRRSLKSLVAAYLQRNIQTGTAGHDSFEDARACAELVLWKAACQLRRNKSENLG